jgi:hypothetical protein
MSDLRPLEIVDKECFVATAPYKTEALLRFVARGAILESMTWKEHVNPKLSLRNEL